VTDILFTLEQAMLKKNFGLKPWKILSMQGLKPVLYAKRVNFAELLHAGRAWVQENIFFFRNTSIFFTPNF
jgi:hypothetical protein